APAGPAEAETAAARAASLALRLASVPADPSAIDEVERDERAPDVLVAAAADALRLRGDGGRARLLLRRARGAESAALAAEVHRRAGDPAAAEAAAHAAIAAGDPSGRARGVLARLALD